MKVSIIGAGRIGLALGACLADKGHQVLFTDKDFKRLKALSRGEVPFYEPGLKTLLRKNRSRLEWTEDPLMAAASRVIFLTVSLPIKPGGDFDLSGVKDWVRQIHSQTRTEKILVLKSTLPPGAGSRLQSLAQQNGAPLYIVTCPEFLRQGRAVRDIQTPERIVIGGRFPKINRKVARLYKTFSRGPVIFTSSEAAEVGKLSANSFLALKISFINLTADLAECFSADINDLREILGSDSRIGKQFLKPGLGFGGSCLPKDLKHLIFQGRKKGISVNLLKSAQALNRQRAERFFQKVKQREKNLRNKTYAFWGLSFKPGTDDIRHSPALLLAGKLLSAGVRLNLFDPLFQKERLSVFKPSVWGFDEERVTFQSDPLSALKSANGLIVGTDCPEFRKIPLKKMKALMKTPFIADGRGVFSPRELKKAGFAFYRAGISDDLTDIHLV